MKQISLAFLVAIFFTAIPARAAGWSSLLLPPNFAQHGIAIDHLFNSIFWITLIPCAAVQTLLLFFVLRYRHRGLPNKARYVKGSIRLELFACVIFTLTLGTLALASAKVWDGYRYDSSDANPANILVIGQQFQWNIIYPGKDGKFGRYLVFPKPTDLSWPHGPGDVQHLFAGVPGPASLPYKQAIAAIDQFIAQPDAEFRLGKALSDPDGFDDDYQDALGRTLYLPVNRPVRITVLSRDVIHDFYLPNFRVQLYAVPGMAGSITFTPTETNEEIEKSTGQPAHLEVICNQLCGIGHSLMKTNIVVLSQEEYHRRFE